MKSPDGNYFKIGRRLTVTLVASIALFLAGNGLVILQFDKARLQTDRLTGVSQQLIAVLRLRESLLSFHQRLNELSQAQDVGRLVTEAKPIRAALLEQTRQTRKTLAYLPSDLPIGPALLAALDTIEITLPAQLEDIVALASQRDWEAVRLRLDNELNRIETTTSSLVSSIERDLDEELPHVVANMKEVNRRIFFLVPATAISTVIMAAFFGWAIARRILELRMEARVSERTRIARDLHDTLLQSFLGTLMRFETAASLISNHPAEAQKMLETACEQARQAVIEGRDAVLGLRGSAVVSSDLAGAIGMFGDGLARDQTVPEPAEFRVHLEGAPMILAETVQTEVYRIACEALRNAFEHADARRIEVDIEYTEQRLRLRVRDDGKGIHPRILAEGRAGHHGLLGLRERAKLVSGKLAIWSELGSGTEIELSIPGSIAFEKPSDTRTSTASREANGQGGFVSDSQ